MKIAHVLKYYHPRITGVTSYVAGLSRELLRSGREVCILTWGDGIAEEQRDGIRVLRIPFHDLRALGAALRAEAPDVVHAHGIWRHTPASAWFCHRLGIPLVITMHGTWLFLHSSAGFESPLRRLRFALYKRTLWRATQASAAAVIALNAHEERELHRSGISEERIQRIPNAVDSETFSLAPDRKASGGGDGGEFVGLFAGALQAQKGVFSLLEAVAASVHKGMPLRFVYCGSGPDAEKCRNLAVALDIAEAVRFAGTVPHEEMPAMLHQADFFALPSFNEPFGTGFLEAMAAGLPCIGSVCGGTPEIIEDGVTGLLASFGDAPALARHMHTLWSDRALARRMGQVGRRRVEERFSWSIVGARIMDLYDRIALPRRA